MLSSQTGDGFKVIAGIGGWLFLANDTNRSLDYLFGRLGWTATERDYVGTVLALRHARIGRYHKFVVPEKAAVYPEYLSDPLRRAPLCPTRPGMLVGLYLGPAMEETKPVGMLYSRGDTHATWLGAYFQYAAIMKHIGMTPMSLTDLTPSLACYDGDLYDALPPDLKTWHDAASSRTAYGLDALVTFHVREPQAQRADHNLPHFPRPSLAMERPGKLPTVVVFRDSTSDRLIELIAEHFARSVFVWHLGDVIAEVLEIEKPDYVLHIMAERFVSAYPTRQAVVRFADQIGRG